MCFGCEPKSRHCRHKYDKIGMAVIWCRCKMSLCFYLQRNPLHYIDSKMCCLFSPQIGVNRILCCVNNTLNEFDVKWLCCFIAFNTIRMMVDGNDQTIYLIHNLTPILRIDFYLRIFVYRFIIISVKTFLFLVVIFLWPQTIQTKWFLWSYSCYTGYRVIHSYTIVEAI